MKEKLQDKIRQRARQIGAIILAHNYQLPAIQDVADFCGDSLELAKISQSQKQDVIVFCGVKFMAETAKILSPEKKVILPVLDAGCPLANMITPRQLSSLKRKHPRAWVVSYVNSTARIKAMSDVCCTSSNAVTVVKNIPAKEVIFIPDKNLGWWVQQNVPEKKVVLWGGCCYVHEFFSLSDIAFARKKHPGAEIMVHPECRSEILIQADFVGSTSGMLKRVSSSRKKTFIIGTEKNMLYRLKKENPAKEFYTLGRGRICEDMKKTALKDLYAALMTCNPTVSVAPRVRTAARRALQGMVKWI